MRLGLAGLLVGAALHAQPPSFDLVDRRAREIDWQFRCLEDQFDMRVRGRLGHADSLGQVMFCLRLNERDVGVWFDVQPGTTTITRLAAFTDDGTRYTAPIDTLWLRRRYWIMHMTVRRMSDDYVSARRDVGPFTIWPRDDSLQSWLIPLDVFLFESAGGERGSLYAVGARDTLGVTDAFAKYRRLAIPDTGHVVIESAEDSVPLLTEMLLANRLNARGRVVSIVTQKRSSTLVGPPGPSAIWVHVLRTKRQP